MLDTIESVNQIMYQILRNGVHIALRFNVAKLEVCLTVHLPHEIT